jgi:RNA polymerase sigma-70 factor, ECF subfamily
LELENNIAEEKALIAEITGGDTQKFRELVERYQQRIFNCAYGITRNKEDASDITQVVFVKFYRNISQFDPNRPLAPYLLKIAVNCSRNELRKRHVHTALDEVEYAVENFEPSPLERLASREKADFLHVLINELPVTLREVCSLFYLSECSCAEVAGILRMTENAVKVSLHRVRKKLLENWRRGGVCYE